MWKVERLYLKNFIHVFSGTGKTEIEIDLSKSNKKLNIFIGKMGSGKSAILGHLQPFSNYGSLDIRNQDSIVIPEEDGEKRIIFLKGTKDKYEIYHRYIWNSNSKSHNTKSYIKHNDIELNENGNISSFKEIIKTEFGIDQSYLRLLRLGPNVFNLINMKSSERKSFIASLLKDAELYTSLHSKLSEEYRGLSSAIKLLTSKMLSLNVGEKDNLNTRYLALSEDMNELNKMIEDYKATIAGKQGEVKVLMGGAELNVYRSLIDKKIEEVNRIRNIINIAKEDLASIDNGMNEQEASVLYGKLLASIEQCNSRILILSEETKSTRHKIATIENKLLSIKNDSTIQHLKDTTAKLKAEYEYASSKTKDFNIPYSYHFLTSFITTINEFQHAMDYIVSNSPEVVAKVFRSDRSILNWSGKRMDALKGRRHIIQQKISNVSFAASYEQMIPLFRPPMCPTHDCPFIKSHPVITKMTSDASGAKTLKDLNNEISNIDKEIYKYETYIELWPRMQHLKESWKNVSTVLQRIGMDIQPSLLIVLTDFQTRINWYNHEELIRITELVKMQEDHQALSNRYLMSQKELDTLMDEDEDTLLAQILELKDIESNQLKELSELHSTLTSDKDKRIELEDYIKRLSSVKNTEKTIESNVVMMNSLSEEINKMEESFNLASTYVEEIESTKSLLSDTVALWNTANHEAEKLKNTLQDISITTASYEEYSEKQALMKLILDAVSAKDGIPLILIKGFLDECREIINDLIQDIFKDDLEVLDFQISEENNDFKIPFMSNGVYVDDISSASQGQQAIISIALSFAICRKSTFDYNVLLLDEVDNSIYRHDREKFVGILFKQMSALSTSQVFLITHNDIFQQSNLPINIIMTTNEVIDIGENQEVIRV